MAMTRPSEIKTKALEVFVEYFKHYGEMSVDETWVYIFLSPELVQKRKRPERERRD